MQSYRKKIKRLVVIAGILVAAIIGITYIYSSQNAAAREKARQLQIQMEKQQKARQEAEYFKQLEEKIHKNNAAHNIRHALNLIKNLTMQASGWEITRIMYDSKKTDQLQIALKRTEFGDILSFRNAYTSQMTSEEIANNNDNGTKVLNFKEKFELPELSQAKIAVIKKTLSNKEPIQRYNFIANAQKMQLKFQTSTVKKERYGFMTSSYSVSGEGLWNLKKLEILMKQFPTITVESITLDINDNKISWTTKGDIYD